MLKDDVREKHEKTERNLSELRYQLEMVGKYLL